MSDAIDISSTPISNAHSTVLKGIALLGFGVSAALLFIWRDVVARRLDALFAAAALAFAGTAPLTKNALWPVLEGFEPLVLAPAQTRLHPFAPGPGSFVGAGAGHSGCERVGIRDGGAGGPGHPRAPRPPCRCREGPYPTSDASHGSAHEDPRAC